MRESDRKLLNAEQLPKIPTDRSSDAPDEFRENDEIPSGDAFWARIKWLHERGFHKGDYREYTKPHYNLNKGAHYFVMDNPAKRTIRCLSCPVTHGGILEPHLLTRYQLREGVLYLDEKPINQVPEGFSPGV